MIDPVNDFLSDGGAGWEMTKNTVKAHDVIGHLREAMMLYGSVQPTGDTTASAPAAL